MLEKIIAFFMSIITFFMQLFGLGGVKNYKEFKNIAYGSVSSAQKEDIYLPNKSEGEVNLIVFIHGGAWIEGDKSDYDGAGIYCARDLGYAAISVNYRMVNEDGVDCDDMMDDITASIAMAKKYVEDNGMTVKKAVLSGGSAGGHLSLLYAYKYYEQSPVEIAFSFVQCAPTDLTDPAFYSGNSIGDDNVRMIVGRLCGKSFTAETFYDEDVQAALRAISPVNYVTSASVPTLFSHGQKDITVPYSNGAALDTALTNAGVKHDFVTYPNSDHGLNSADDKTEAENYDALMYEYLRTYLA